MTRINANISIKELTDQHLLAEHREIKRICNRYRKRLEKSSQCITQKHAFCLGRGHELFFVDKGKFTLNRYISIREECKLRGFNVTDFEESWKVYQKDHMNDYHFHIDENDTVRYRIAIRIIESKQKPRYYGKTISKVEAVKLLQFENFMTYSTVFQLFVLANLTTQNENYENIN